MEEEGGGEVERRKEGSKKGRRGNRTKRRSLLRQCKDLCLRGELVR